MYSKASFISQALNTYICFKRLKKRAEPETVANMENYIISDKIGAIKEIISKRNI